MFESQRDFFEDRFGHDFGRVRIHDDSKSGRAARRLNAEAFTIGNDIVFDHDKSPSIDTPANRKILGHELVHVLQQSSSSSEPAGLATKRGIHVVERVPPGQITRRSPATAGTGSDEPGTSATQSAVEAALASQYPRLLQVLTDEQKQSILDAFRYREELRAIDVRLSELVYNIPGAGEAYASEDEPEITRLRLKAADLGQRERRAFEIGVDTVLLLDTYSFMPERTTGESTEPKVVEEYKRTLYYNMSSQRTALVVQDVDPARQPSEMIKFEWGPDRWEVPHDGGLISFDHLLQIEAINLEYQQVLIERSLEGIEEIMNLEPAAERGKEIDERSDPRWSPGKDIYTGAWDITVFKSPQLDIVFSVRGKLSRNTPNPNPFEDETKVAFSTNLKDVLDGNSDQAHAIGVKFATRMATMSLDPEILEVYGVNFVKVKMELGEISTTDLVSLKVTVVKLRFRAESTEQLSRDIGIPEDLRLQGQITFDFNIKSDAINDVLKRADDMAEEGRKGSEIADELLEDRRKKAAGGVAEEGAEQSAKHRTLRKISDRIEQHARPLREGLERVDGMFGPRMARFIAKRGVRVVLKAVPILNVVSTVWDLVELAHWLSEYMRTHWRVGATEFQTKFPTFAQIGSCPMNSAGGKMRINEQTYKCVDYPRVTAPLAGLAFDAAGRLVHIRVENGKEVVEDYQGWLMATHPGEGRTTY